ncbi:MAG: 4Fe-4S dicluster domain-containing protein [Bacillota bacterium]
MKRVYVNPEFCLGCKLCEIHCIAAHSKHRNNVLKAFKETRFRPVSRVIVEGDNLNSFAVQCRHCDEMFCAKACITGALQKDPKTGAVAIEESRCVGCWTCVLACPFGAVFRHYGEKKYAVKCDLCGGEESDPACVKHCPNEALVLRE